jgi:hypothetical protein
MVSETSRRFRGRPGADKEERPLPKDHYVVTFCGETVPLMRALDGALLCAGVMCLDRRSQP